MISPYLVPYAPWLHPTPALGTTAYPIPTYDMLVYRNTLNASLALQPCASYISIVRNSFPMTDDGQ